LPDAALIWDPTLASYRLRPGHPLNPRRLEITVDLIRRMGLAAEPGTGPDEAATIAPILPPRHATVEELLTVHSPEYVQAVQHLSTPGADWRTAIRFGLGTEDTPVMPDMHDAARLVVGATLVAAEAVMSGRFKRSFAIAGGLHHAHRGAAAGFCVYNDLAVAARWMQRAHGARVMYIDYDAHHGDGVQEIFYDDPDVLTVSIHESGTYLFPGTGFIDELGEGDGYGFSVNVPLDVHTEDGSLRGGFQELIPALADAFRPDVILLQNGCDAHVLDPLTHLRCTTRVFEELVRVVCEVADHHCEGRVVATGGGGYAIYTVVPRAWTLVWAALRGLDAPDEIPADWLREIAAESGEDLSPTLRDAADAFPASPRRTEVEANNDRTLRAVRQRVLPLLTGWGLAF
jgi:acetoin utilization protein AcuC